jgi:hypothetical protein
MIGPHYAAAWHFENLDASNVDVDRKFSKAHVECTERAEIANRIGRARDEADGYAHDARASPVRQPSAGYT